MIRSGLLAALGVGAGFFCSACAASSDAVDSVITATGETSSTSPVPGMLPPPVAGPSLFDFRDNRLLAHAVHAAGPFLDTTGASVLKHIRGGWRGSGWSVDGTLGGEHALVLGQRAGIVTVPLTDAGAAAIAEIGFRIFPGAPGIRVSVFLNEVSLGDVAVDEAEWQSVRLAVPTGLAKSGENEVRFFVSRTGKVERRKVGLGLTRLWLGPTATTPPASLQEFFPPERALLRLPAAGDRLAWYLQIPPRARLWLEPAAVGACALDVVAHEDDAPAVYLARLKATGVAAALDLARFAGRTIRLELAAVGDGCRDLTVRHAALVGPPDAMPPADSPGADTALPPADHVVFWVVDSLRADVLGPYGGLDVHTPNLDAFAASGTVFRHAVAQGSETKVSVASLFTSSYPTRNEFLTSDDRLPSDLPFLPELFKAAGFRTAGYVANGYVSGRWGFGRGWDDFVNFIRARKTTHARKVLAHGLAWLEEEEPEHALLYLHSTDPHVAYRAHPGILERYDPAPYAGPFTRVATGFDLADWKSGRKKWTDRDKERLVALYRNEVTFNDQIFGELLAALPTLLAGRITVVVTSDHGEELFDHDSVGHGHSLYEEITSVPIVISDGGHRFPAGAVVADAVEVLDLLPTVLAATGIPSPEPLQGIDLSSLARHSTKPRYVRPAFSFHVDWWRSMRIGGWKLHLRGPNTLLYDLDEDPGETSDLTGTRPVALRHCVDVMSFFLHYSAAWSKRTHGEAANHSAAFAAAAEHRSL